MKWTKAKDKPPPQDEVVVFRLGKNRQLNTGKLFTIQAYLNGGYDELEWLDEQSPSFSIDEMRKCWDDGAFNGVWNYQQNLSSKDKVTFKDFMQEEYKLDIP